MRKASILKLKKVVYGLFLVFLTACGNVSPASPTPTLTPTATTKPTVFPTSTATPLPTNTNTPKPTPTKEIKQYEQCDADDWRNCELSIQDLMPNGDYWRWLDQSWNPNLPEPSPDNQCLLMQSDQFIFLSADKQHPIPKAVRPYAADFTYGYVNCGVSWGGVSHEMTCPVIPIALSIPGRPGETVKIIGIVEQGYNEGDSEITSIFKGINGNQALMLGGYEIDPTGKLVLKSGDTIDLMQQYVYAYPDLYERLQKFQETNDPTWIEGIVFKAFSLR